MYNDTQLLLADTSYLPDHQLFERIPDCVLQQKNPRIFVSYLYHTYHVYLRSIVKKKKQNKHQIVHVHDSGFASIPVKTLFTHKMYSFSW